MDAKDLEPVSESVNDRHRLMTVAVDVASGCVVLAFLGLVLSSILGGDRSQPVVTPSCRRIAAVYVGMRLYQLERQYRPSMMSQDAPVSVLAKYVRYVPGNPLDRTLIPDLADYDIDTGFLANETESDHTRIVVVSKTPEKGTRARIVVLSNGTMKAVEGDEPLVGKRIGDVNARIYEVTPEEGIIIK